MICSLAFFWWLAGQRLFNSSINVLTIFITELQTYLNPQASITQPGWFSLKYLAQNLPQYLQTVTGQPVSFLWEHQALLPSWLAISGWWGWLLALKIKKARFLASLVLLFTGVQIIIAASFYSFEARYIYWIIAVLILGAGFFWQQLYQSLQSLTQQLRPQLKPLLSGGSLVLILIYYAVPQLMTWKNQLMLNFKYAETPWYYLAVQNLNSFFHLAPASQPPLVISAMSPYFIDYYSNYHYQVLPLSTHQDFFAQRHQVWGDFTEFAQPTTNKQQINLLTLYENLLKQDRPVYLSKYGLGNESGKNADFAKIASKFQLDLVQTGCHDLCNIYQLKLRSPSQDEN
ncbi:MAG: hypothetical protein GF390_02500 [Candidatus Pacebacteria bacterium]|nr:hypothetical protein [Candidatus Paceibacterota bacterium]